MQQYGSYKWWNEFIENFSDESLFMATLTYVKYENENPQGHFVWIPIYAEKLPQKNVISSKIITDAHADIRRKYWPLQTKFNPVC